MKKEEKKPLNWEMVDPKPPIIQSGHIWMVSTNTLPSISSFWKWNAKLYK